MPLAVDWKPPLTTLEKLSLAGGRRHTIYLSLHIGKSWPLTSDIGRLHFLT